MKNSIQNEAEMKAVKHGTSFGSNDGRERNEETDISIKDPDTMLSMTVLLLACLALAALAHVFVS